jgi:hypothetical protein
VQNPAPGVQRATRFKLRGPRFEKKERRFEKKERRFEKKERRFEKKERRFFKKERRFEQGPMETGEAAHVNAEKIITFPQYLAFLVFLL